MGRNRGGDRRSNGEAGKLPLEEQFEMTTDQCLERGSNIFQEL